MSSEYDGMDPRQRLRDILQCFEKIDKYTATLTEANFVADELVHLAVVRLLEMIYEAAYWFAKNENGKAIVQRYENVDFGVFGGAGNLYRHQYGRVDYVVVWNDLKHSDDLAALRSIVVKELES